LYHVCDALCIHTHLPHTPRAPLSEGWAKSKSKAKEYTPADSEFWAEATAEAFDMLLQVVQEEYGEMTKPEWWNDESPKALSKSGLGL
tara:strand:+ start:248 stop:511 length:264 start_codon:yes stop_codon:yes gene_type:complete